ncbi:MAG: hypothetical protein EFT35_10685 [Methanophagales archaeon ANME-1-THS]|nr:MAG: hypothetical protein EFT35_10685 [Methanophagales archaeon ANME-1-THS]
MVKTKTICFDLEGPLSPQDNAYEVMKLIGKEGALIFEVISRYDDIIALEGRQGYEPGDTLALIVPFLLAHSITEADISRVSARAKLVEGAEYLFERLRAATWDIYIISTSYEPHAYTIGRQLGVPEDHIICTNLNLAEKKRMLRDQVFAALRDAEHELLDLHADLETNSDRIKTRLDKLFFEQLPALGYYIFSTRVIGGARKAEAIRAIAQKKGLAIQDIIAVGDSITDFKMLQEVATHGGVAVVFNGNQYAVPYANIGLASVDIRFLYLLCEAFARGGKSAVMELVTNWEANRHAYEEHPETIPDGYITPDIKSFLMQEKGKRIFPYFHNLDRADERRKSEILAIHKRLRLQVRELCIILG